MKLSFPRLWPFSRSANEQRQLKDLVQKITELETELRNLSTDALCSKTSEFQRRIVAGEGLDNLLPEAYAVAREAARRSSLQQRPHDTQVMAAIALHWGRIIEMKNGEGKTLSATIAAYLHILGGQKVHLITANEYLAKRDAEWMGPVYGMLGLTVGVIQPGSKSFLYDAPARWSNFQTEKPFAESLRSVDRREAYKADVLYAPCDEILFDYLRDNMVPDISRIVQRGFDYAIVDEADIVMLDLANQPYIISGSAESSSDLYNRFAQLVRLIPSEEIEIDKSIKLSDKAIEMFEERLEVDNLYTSENQELVYHLDLALKAKFQYHRDDDYIVKDGQIIVIDQVRRRPLPGRYFGQGLHQALEAKEGLRLKNESFTWGTVTVQNYLRRYKLLAGMTGSASTDWEEFKTIYDLDVIVIPTNSPVIRIDHSDVVYKNKHTKMRAVVREIKEMYELGRPVLVGSRSDEDADLLSDLLVREGIDHVILSGKYHEREAEIIAEAGQIGQVTISTRMAGRGVDIVLGPGVKELGGLHVIGTERQESRRLDEQLRGRAGRQGDPGSSRFYLALNDNLMRRFGGQNVVNLMERFGVEDDIPIEAGIVSKSIENAQTKVEGHNLDIRKHLLKYDDVINQQREITYGERRRILASPSLKDSIQRLIKRHLSNLIHNFTANEFPEQWDLVALHRAVRMIMPLPPTLTSSDWANLSSEEIEEQILDLAHKTYAEMEEALGSETMRHAEKQLMQQMLDQLWVRHLTALDALRQGIGLRAIGQQDPLVAFQKEAFEMYQQFQAAIQEEVVRRIYHPTIIRVAPQPKNLQAKPKTLSFNETTLLAQRYPMVWPALGEIFRTFDEHNAIDILLTAATPVVAAVNGKVNSVKRSEKEEFSVTIDHGDGLETHYLRLTSIAVEPEQKVVEGELIGKSSETLHFGVYYQDVPVNPLFFLQINLDSLLQKYPMVWPVQGEITKDFSEYHAIDIRVEPNSTVAAAASGKVRLCKQKDNEEFYVIINHGEVETVYLHLSSVFVEADQYVVMATPIGISNNLLHFAVFYHDLPLDPMIFIEAKPNQDEETMVDL